MALPAFHPYKYEPPIGQAAYLRGPSYDVRLFGVVMDLAATDAARISQNTTRLQSAFNAGVNLSIPSGVLRFDGTISVPVMHGRTVTGASRVTTDVVCHTNNIPMFILNGPVNGIRWRSMTLRHFAQQTGMTNGNIFVCRRLSLSTSVHNSLFEDLFLDNSYIGFLAENQTGTTYAIWRTKFDRLWFGSGFQGKAFDFQVNSGECPGNHWGDIYISSPSMVGPVFDMQLQDGALMDNIELSGMNAGPTILKDTNGSAYHIRSIDLSGGTYTGTTRDFIQLDNCDATFDRLMLQSFTVNMSDANQYLTGIRFGGASNVTKGLLRCYKLVISSLTMTQGVVYAVRPNDGAVDMRIGSLYLQSHANIRRAPMSLIAPADNYEIETDTRARVKKRTETTGTVTLVVGDETIQTFNSALTGNVIVVLPDGTSIQDTQLLTRASWFRIVRNGTGAFTLEVRNSTAGGTLLHTFASSTTGNVEFRWSRDLAAWTKTDG